ncbi:glycine betaine ABC transporter substrate-binding protein [Brevibacillus sp. H7]|uniref:ABC transporter substrate-binding protein n=1 Tax=Brevibacillus sp. H7 TaxID=3349138 RepID=UPI00380E960B
MKKSLYFTLIFALALFALAGCGNGNPTASQNKESSSDPIVVGTKYHTESYILSKITALYLKEKGYKIEEAGQMGGQLSRKALENNQIDIYWDYTGTALVNYLKQDPISDSKKAYELLAKMDKEKNNIIWLSPAAFNNTFALLLKKEKAQELGIESISDLAAYINKNPETLTFGTNAEFAGRPDGLKGIEKAYGFKFGSKNVKQMETGLPIQALHNGEVDVAVAYSTDGRIKAYNLKSLTDDKVYFPAYNGVVTTRADVLEQYPELDKELKPIVDKLDDETITDLNYQVDYEKKSVEEVAKQWLVQNGFMKSN